VHPKLRIFIRFGCTSINKIKLNRSQNEYILTILAALKTIFKARNKKSDHGINQISRHHMSNKKALSISEEGLYSGN